MAPKGNTRRQDPPEDEVEFVADGTSPTVPHRRVEASTKHSFRINLTVSSSSDEDSDDGDLANGDGKQRYYRPPRQHAARSGSCSPRSPASSASTPYSVGLEGDVEAVGTGVDNFYGDDDCFVSSVTPPANTSNANLNSDPVSSVKVQDDIFSSKGRGPATVEMGTHARLPAWLDVSCIGKQLTLHEEIVRFCAYVEPFADEQARRQQLISRLRAIVRSLWSRADLVSFGSYRTGLFLPVSDLDLVVFGTSHDSGKSALYRLANKLRVVMGNSIRALKVISHARVPIVKFTDADTLTEVDISFEQESGLDSSAFIVSSMSVWPELKPLVLVLKYFLRLRSLNEPYTGGVGSYALVIMVLSHLQMYRKHVSPPDLGELLCSFMELYGRSFNYVTTGICVRDNGSYFPKESRGWENAEARVSIEDPQCPENDVGRATYQILDIQKAFADAFNVLRFGNSLPSRKNSPHGPQSQTILQRFFGAQSNVIENHRMSCQALAVKRPVPNAAQTPEHSHRDEESRTQHRHHQQQHHHHHQHQQQQQQQHNQQNRHRRRSYSDDDDDSDDSDDVFLGNKPAVRVRTQDDFRNNHHRATLHHGGHARSHGHKRKSPKQGGPNSSKKTRVR